MPAIAHQDATLAPTPTRNDVAHDALEDAFLDWLLGAAKPQQLHLDGPDAPPTPADLAAPCAVHIVARTSTNCEVRA